LLFSRAFDIARTADDDWFDVILDSDTELFVDPFLIFKEPRRSDWGRAHAELVAHFDDIFKLLARAGMHERSPYYQKALGLLLFPEPQEFCLGYTARGTRGSGGGADLARQIARAMVAAIERGIEHLDHFETLGIFNRNIGPDRISDLTCTLLKERFVDYTLEVVDRHELDTERHTVRFAGIDGGHWVEITADLPTNPVTGGPVLLVPLRFLRRLPTLNADDWWAFHGVRAQLNIDVLEAADKREIIRQAWLNRDSVDEFVGQRERRRASPYDLPQDRDAVWQWEPITFSYTEGHPLDLRGFARARRFDDVIETVVAQYRQFIENEAGWEHLWNDDGTEKHERAAQNLFRGIAKHYCNANDIAIDREVDLGRGPVDFKFSRGAALKALLEVKKLHNGSFWHGLDTQLPIYASSDESGDGWLLAVQLRTGGVSRSRAVILPRRVAEVAQDTGLNLRYALVDGRRQLPASKARRRRRRA
jgi:hypothetical protein